MQKSKKKTYSNIFFFAKSMKLPLFIILTFFLILFWVMLFYLVIRQIVYESLKNVLVVSCYNINFYCDKIFLLLCRYNKHRTQLKFSRISTWISGGNRHIRIPKKICYGTVQNSARIPRRLIQKPQLEFLLGFLQKYLENYP